MYTLLNALTNFGGVIIHFLDIVMLHPRDEKRPSCSGVQSDDVFAGYIQLKHLGQSKTFVI